MNLLKVFQDALASMWVTFGNGNLLFPVTYIHITRQPYVPGGRVVVSENPHPINEVALVDYDLQMNPRTDIAVSDKNCFIKYSDLPFKLSVDDRVIEGDGTEWTVRGIGGFTPVYHDLQLRKR